MEKTARQEKIFPFILILPHRKTITYPPQRYNTGAVRSQTFAQKLDMCVQRSRVAIIIVSPHLIDQFFSRQCNSPIANHIKKQIILFGRHGHRFFVHADYTGGKIHCKARRTDTLLFLCHFRRSAAVSAPPEYAASVLWEKTA